MKNKSKKLCNRNINFGFEPLLSYSIRAYSNYLLFIYRKYLTPVIIKGTRSFIFKKILLF